MKRPPSSGWQGPYFRPYAAQRQPLPQVVVGFGTIRVTVHRVPNNRRILAGLGDEGIESKGLDHETHERPRKARQAFVAFAFFRDFRGPNAPQHHFLWARVPSSPHRESRTALPHASRACPWLTFGVQYSPFVASFPRLVPAWPGQEMRGYMNDKSPNPLIPARNATV